MFVPSLPLMQSEVRQHGTQAVEQVAELFVTMMTLGEMLGPIFGGWLVGQVGFVRGSLVLAVLLVPLFTLSVCTYDAKIVRARHGRRSLSLAEALTDCEDRRGDGQGICGESCGPNCTVVPSDGEASFAWRRIPFALDVKRTTASMPSSAPSSIFRREYAPENAQKPYMTAPQNTRRTYRHSI